MDRNGHASKRILRPIEVTKHHLKAYCMTPQSATSVRIRKHPRQSNRWLTSVLSDIERKTLRIIHNFQAGRKRLTVAFRTVRENRLQSGRDHGGIEGFGRGNIHRVALQQARRTCLKLGNGRNGMAMSGKKDKLLVILLVNMCTRFCLK
jgi:hypothetical protein